MRSSVEFDSLTCCRRCGSANAYRAPAAYEWSCPVCGWIGDDPEWQTKLRASYR